MVYVCAQGYIEGRTMYVGYDDENIFYDKNT